MREKKVRGRWNKLPKIRQLKGETESRRDLLQESMAKLKSELEMKAKLRAKKQSRAEQSKAKIISSKRATTTTEGYLCFWFEKGGTIFIGIGAHASTWGKGLHVDGWIELCWLRRLCLDWEPIRMWAPRARDENRCEIAKSFFLYWTIIPLPGLIIGTGVPLVANLVGAPELGFYKIEEVT